MANKAYHLIVVLAVAFNMTPSFGEEMKAITKKELSPAQDGKKVTMLFTITRVQATAGSKEGEFSDLVLHYTDIKQKPPLNVWARGELADALHHFGCVGNDTWLSGRTIKATGELKRHILKDDNTPLYELNLREWRKFQVLPMPKRE